MKKYTHWIFALLLFLLFQFILKFPIYLSIFAVIGTMLPDLDIKWKKYHRKLFHNIWILLIILFLGFNFHLIDRTIGIIISIGFISHLIIDAITPSGVMFLWPLKKPKIKGPIKTGSLGEFGLMIAMVIIIFFIGGFI